MKRKDKILTSVLNGMQRDIVVNQICNNIKNDINHGEIIFDDYTKNEGFNHKGIKWKLDIELIEK